MIEVRWYPEDKKPDNAGEAVQVIERAFAPAEAGRVDLDMEGRAWRVSRAERLEVDKSGKEQPTVEDMRAEIAEALEAAGFVINRPAPVRLPRAETIERKPELSRRAQPPSGEESDRTRPELVRDPTWIESPTAFSGSNERRNAKRLDWPVGFRLRVIDTSGRLLGEELTIAENASPAGARVMTSFSWLSIGDVVQVEERDSPFRRAWAEIRGKYVGRDGISRLNLSFVSAFLSRPQPCD